MPAPNAEKNIFTHVCVLDNLNLIGQNRSQYEDRESSVSLLLNGTVLRHKRGSQNMIKSSWGVIFEAEMSGILVRNPAVPISCILFFAYFNSSLVYPYT